MMVRGHQWWLTSGEAPIDLTPDTGRLVLFWANEIPHEAVSDALNDSWKRRKIMKKCGLSSNNGGGFSSNNGGLLQESWVLVENRS